MTPEILLVLGILVAVIAVLVTEIMPLEVLAMLVLGILAVTGLVSPTEALAGFSNPAVVTIWAVFILSGGLTRNWYCQYSRAKPAEGRGNRRYTNDPAYHGDCRRSVCLYE